MKTSEWLNLAVQLATVFSVFFAALAIWASAQMNKRQMNMQIFTTYSDRYERIMSDFPENAFVARFDIGQKPQSSEELNLCILRYLNMSSEEFYLWKTGYLDESVWRIWEQEIKRMICSPMIVYAWCDLKMESEFESYPDFQVFVNDILPQRKD